MALDSLDIHVVRELTHQRAGIVISAASEYLVETRLAPVAEELGLASVQALIQRLREREWSPLHARVVEAMTTNETSFFRDHHPFASLRTEIIPRLITARARERKLAFWCAACSSGQEPYSLLMLLREHFPELAAWEVTIWATDYSAAMVDRTREGVFNQHEIQRGLPAELRDRWFRREGTDWRAVPELRSALELRTLNLTEAFPPLPKFDVVMLRNVLIYFDVETKRKILARVAAQMQPDGLLLLGATETTFNVDDRFESVRVGQTPCFRLRPGGEAQAARKPAAPPVTLEAAAANARAVARKARESRLAGTSPASAAPAKEAAPAAPAATTSVPNAMRMGRSAARFNVPCVVTVRSASATGRGVLVNLSLSGARLDWVYPAPVVGEHVWLQLHLLGAEPSWEIEAEVVRETATGCGVRFVKGHGLECLMRDLGERLRREELGRSD